MIHAVADNQDLRRYGGLINYLPLTYSVMLIASLSLVAFPFLSGFYSKDFILESAFGQFTFSGIAVYIIATIGAIFTTLYSVKVLYLTFLTTPNGSRRYFGYLFKTEPRVTLERILKPINIYTRREREYLHSRKDGWYVSMYNKVLVSDPKYQSDYWVFRDFPYNKYKARYIIDRSPIKLPALPSEGNIYMTLPALVN